MPLTSGLRGRCDKSRHWINECRSTKYMQGNPLLSENAVRALSDPYTKSSSVISCHHRGNSFPKHLKNLMPLVRNHTALNNRMTIKERRKDSEEIIKQVFWQTSTNEQRQKFKIQINDVVIEDLVNIDVYVTIISSES